MGTSQAQSSPLCHGPPALCHVTAIPARHKWLPTSRPPSKARRIPGHPDREYVDVLLSLANPSQFDISARGEWSEAARLRVFDSNGKQRYDGETDKNGSCLARIRPTLEQTGKCWSLLVSKPANRVFDDAYLSILAGVPAYLATDPTNLLVPKAHSVRAH